MGLPQNVEAIRDRLPPEWHETFDREYLKRRKSLLIAYLLCLLGWHYLYLGKLKHQIAFYLTLGGLLIWGIADLFRLPGMVAKENEEIAWKVVGLYYPGAHAMGKLPAFLG